MQSIDKLPHKSRQKLGRIYEKYGRKMYSAAFSVLKNQSDAEDAVQNGILKIADKLNELDSKPDEVLRGYVLTVAKNEAYNIIRKRDNALPFEELREKEDGTDITVKVTDDAEFDFAVSVIREMDEKYRAPLYLRYVAGFSLKETAKQLGKNEATVRSQISRGLSRLKKALKEAGYES